MLIDVRYNNLFPQKVPGEMHLSLSLSLSLYIYIYIPNTTGWSWIGVWENEDGGENNVPDKRDKGRATNEFILDLSGQAESAHTHTRTTRNEFLIGPLRDIPQSPICTAITERCITTATKGPLSILWEPHSDESVLGIYIYIYIYISIQYMIWRPYDTPKHGLPSFYYWGIRGWDIREETVERA